MEAFTILEKHCLDGLVRVATNVACHENFEACEEGGHRILKYFSGDPFAGSRTSSTDHFFLHFIYFLFHDLWLAIIQN
jgi:hypothetical protein